MSTEIITGIQSIDQLDPKLLQSNAIKAGFNGPFEIFKAISDDSKLTLQQIESLKLDLDKIFAQIYANRFNQEIYKKLYLKFLVGIKLIAVNENFYNEPTYARYQEDGEGIIAGLGTSWALNTIDELGYNQKFIIETAIIFNDYFPALDTLNLIIKEYERTGEITEENIETATEITTRLTLSIITPYSTPIVAKNIGDIKDFKKIIESLINKILIDFFNGYYNGKNYLEKLPKSA